jgi:hypothetical protein
MVNPPDEPFTWLDLPLAFDVTDEEFDKIADLKLAEQVIAGGYTFLRVE